MSELLYISLIAVCFGVGGEIARAAAEKRTQAMQRRIKRAYPFSGLAPIQPAAPIGEGRALSLGRKAGGFSLLLLSHAAKSPFFALLSLYERFRIFREHSSEVTA
jgi:hypothetical protein